VIYDIDGSYCYHFQELLSSEKPVLFVTILSVFVIMSLCLSFLIKLYFSSSSFLLCCAYIQKEMMCVIAHRDDIFANNCVGSGGVVLNFSARQGCGVIVIAKWDPDSCSRMK
jgi:hypothetical protein